MAGWRFEFLGTPRALRDETILLRLRSRRSWAVLAALTLETGPHRRGALAQRFWPDAEAPLARKSLREALFSIRTVLGATVLAEDRETVQWAAEATLDLSEMRALAAQARRLAPDDPARRARLEAAAACVRGPFLEGIDDPEGFGWVETQRALLRQEIIDLLRELAPLQRDAGERDAAARNALLLLQFDPDDEIGRQISLQSLHPQTRRRLSETLQWDEAEALLEAGETLSVAEGRILETLVRRQLADLPSPDRRALCALAVFPDAFSTEAARAVAGADEVILARLEGRRLIAGDGRGFALRPPVRNILWHRLTGEERHRLRERHATHFYERFGHTPGVYEDPVWIARFWQEATDLRLALDWIRHHHPSVRGVALMMAIHNWRLHNPSAPDLLEECTAYLEEATRLEDAWHAGTAAQLRGEQALEARDFQTALLWLGLSLDIRERGGVDLIWSFERFLGCAHHAGADEDFDAAVVRVQAYLQRYPPREQAAYASHIVFHVAENRYARRRYDEALAHNDRAFALRQEGGKDTDRLGPLHKQRALILRALGRDSEAEKAWDRAILDFSARNNLHGVAECYEQLGALAAQQGRIGLGLSLVQQAIALFTDVDNPGAVAAAKGILGEIYRQQGELARARALFEEGLAFWTANGHARWMQRFQERLAGLEAIR